MRAEEFVARLDGAKRRGDSWVARCPAHEDKTPSLSITQGRDGRVLLHCHAGCEPDAIARALGFELRDLFPPREERAGGNGGPLRRIVELRDYTDEDGTLLYQVVRFEPKDFRQRRPDPEREGEWKWNLDGVRPVLYRLPDVLEAVALAHPVYVVEGEKDADALARCGLCATTNAMGAGKWRDEYAESLRGAHVIILPDNDEPGQRHARQVALSLHGVAASVRVVNLPGLPPKADVSDWLAAGGTVEQLEGLVSAAPERAPVPRRLTLGEALARPDIIAPLNPVVPRLVYERRSTLLVAGEKDGKSTYVAYAVAQKSQGGVIAGIPTTPGTVLVFGLEEFLGDVAMRLERFGAHHDRVHLVCALESASMDDRLAEVRSHIEAVRPDLAVIDTLIAYHGGRVKSTNDDSEMQPVVQGLSDLAHEMGPGLLIVAHARKSGGSWRGSGVIGGAVDVIAMMTIPEPKDSPNVREIAQRGRVPVETYRVSYVGNGFDLVANEAAEVSARVRDFVTLQPGCSQKKLRDGVTAQATKVDQAVAWLIERGLIVDRGGSRGHAYYPAEEVVRGTAHWDDPRTRGQESAQVSPLPGRPGRPASGRGSDDPSDEVVPSRGQGHVDPRPAPYRGRDGTTQPPGRPSATRRSPMQPDTGGRVVEPCESLDTTRAARGGADHA